MARIVTAAVVGWLVSYLGQTAIVHAQTDPRILIEAMQANRESINPLECDYSVTNYEAASLRDALEGRMRETADHRYATLHGVLKLRDEMILIRERYDTPPQDSGLDASTGQGAIRFVATQYLTEGTLRFSNHPYFKGATLFEPHEENFQKWTSSHTPWSYNSGCDWGWNVYETLRGAIDQKKCSVTRGVDALGRDVEILRCEDADRRDYYFSSTHGDLLVQIDLYFQRDQQQQPSKRTCVTDIVRAPGGGYFPRRTLSFSYNTAVGDPNRNLFLVKELVADRVDFNPKLRDEDFELTIAADTGLILGMDSRATGGGVFSAERKLLARDLPQLKQEAIENTARRHRLQSLGLTPVPTAEPGGARRLAVRLLPWLLAAAAIASLARVVRRRQGVWSSSPNSSGP
ncbi:MAG: hypothetical protein ACK5WR_01780 [Planctomycetaceae bacterium]